FYEIGAGDGKERNVGFAGDGAGKKSFASAWRADQKDALGNAAAELLEFLRVLEELDDFLKLFLGFVGACHVFEGGFLLLSREEARAGLAETESLVAASLHLAHEEQAKADEKKKRSGVKENDDPVAAADFFNFDGNGLVVKLLGDLRSRFLVDSDVEL